MNVVLFCDHQNNINPLLSAVYSARMEGSIEVYRTLESLFRKLRAAGTPRSILVVAISAGNTLEALLQERRLIEDMRKVIVLLRSDSETIEKVHRLYPRYVAFPERRFRDLSAVLARMSRRPTEDYHPINGIS